MGLGVAIGALIKCTLNRNFSKQVKALALTAESEKKVLPSEASSGKTTPQTVSSEQISLLRHLQKEGRLVDFLEENLSDYQDEEIGASARSVHDGVKRALSKNFKIEKIIDQEEDTAYRINSGYPSQYIKLSGRVSESYPLKGILLHPGWKVSMPKGSALQPGEDVISPAEVEIR